MSANDFLCGELLVTDHRGSDDLLSAGLGLHGLAGLPIPFADPVHPSVGALRRRAIQMSWKAIADLGPLGGYGQVYGSVPAVAGREYHSFARIPGARAPHRVLVQIPDHFDRARPCLVVTASSGSRGIYAGLALAGAWGLPRGYAVAYTDKGGGSGYYDGIDDSGVALDGRRARRGDSMLEFEPELAPAEGAIAVKHMHSGDHPEADWGQHVLQAARFGLAMLDRAFPELAPFNEGNTRIIATGLSNGGGAVLQAAAQDHQGLLAGVVAVEPNVLAGRHGRPLYDYASEAALWMPAALCDVRFAAAPYAWSNAALPQAAGITRCASLAVRGQLGGLGVPAQARQALDRLRASGWEEGALASAAITQNFDLWRTMAAGYASAYLRGDANHMPGGFHYAAGSAGGMPSAAEPVIRASWWSDGNGIPPGNGIGLYGGTDYSFDPLLPGIEALWALWRGEGPQPRSLREAVAATAAGLPPKELPLWVVHGTEDGLIPTSFSSAPYIEWLREEGRHPVYWKVPYAQHFDAMLALPGFGDRHLPLLPYAYAALDLLCDGLARGGAAGRKPPVVDSHPRGAGPLTRAAIGL